MLIALFLLSHETVIHEATLETPAISHELQLPNDLALGLRP